MMARLGVGVGREATEAMEATLAAEAALTLLTEATFCTEMWFSIASWLWIATTISTTAKLLLSTATMLWADAETCRASALKADVSSAAEDAALVLTMELLVITGIGVIVSSVLEVVEMFVEFPPPLPAPGMKPIGIVLTSYPVPLGRGGSISVVPLPESISQIA